MTEKDKVSAIFEQIQKSRHIGIFTHMSPDGDALGSSFGMAGYLKECGKEFSIFIPSEVSDSLKFMIPEDLKKNIVLYCSANKDKVKICDLLIGIDFNCLYRIGNWENPFRQSKAYKILIDHHQNPEKDAFDSVESETEISSASELAYNIIKMFPGINGDATKLSSITREALMTGMTTDTNNFANSVYPSTLKMASELLAAGTDRDKIIRELYFSYPVRRIKAQGYILDKLLKITNFGVAYIFLDSRTQTRFGLKEGDTEGFVNIPLSLEKVKMSIFARRERGHKKIRISIRSKKGTSALQCAREYFHGGGHELASGGKLIIGEDVASEKDVCKYIENYSRLFMEKK